MNTRDELIADLGISLSTFKRWCKAWDIPINKDQYSDEDLEKLLHCQEAMTSKSDKKTWREYLQSIGKEEVEPQQTISSSLVARYSSDIDGTAETIADGLVMALDVAVATKFTQKLGKQRSPIFSKVLAGFSSVAPRLGESDDLLFLEGEIVDVAGELPAG